MNIFFTNSEAITLLHALALAGRAAKREEDQDQYFELYDRINTELTERRPYNDNEGNDK